jgi:hypothetical protein
MPPELSSADVIAMAAALVSAIGGAAAAFAAFRSASHAREASAYSVAAEHRLITRELVGAVHSVLSEVTRAHMLADSYLSELTTVEVFTRNRGHSSGVALRAAVQADLEKLDAMRVEASRIRDGFKDLATTSIADLSVKLARLHGSAAEAQLVCESLNRRLISASAQNRAYRDTTIQRTTQPGA